MKKLFVLLMAASLLSFTKTNETSLKEERNTAVPQYCLKVVRWIPGEYGEVGSPPVPVHCMKLLPCPDHPAGAIN